MKTIAAEQQQQQPVANIEDVLEPEDLSLEPEELKSVPDPKPRNRFVQDEIERELKIEGGRAWQFYGTAQTRILNQIAKEKDQRRHQLFLIDCKEKKLEEMTKRLELIQHDLTTRESNLKDRETQELMQYGSLQKQIESANQELAMINMATIQKKQALTVVEDLLNRGVTQQQIIQLINFAGEWNNYWQIKGNLQQPNNSGPDSNNGNNDSNLSQTDQIKLNLLRNATTNMLKRMGTTP